MELIDTHNHLYLEEFDPDRDSLVKTAAESGIGQILLPNVDLSSIDRMHELCDRYPGFFRPMMGLHPTSVDKSYAETLKKTEAYFSKRPYCGIGEIGMDLYWDRSFLKQQTEAFEEQLRWSIDLDLPVAIHCRDAFPHTLESIHKVGASRLKGVFHSFSGSEKELADVEKLPGFLIGINGIVTFRNSGLAATLRRGNLGRIVLETDAPYLAPVPYRGRRNEPHYIWKTAEKIAEIFSVPLATVVKSTTQNAQKLFGTGNTLI